MKLFSSSMRTSLYKLLNKSKFLIYYLLYITYYKFLFCRQSQYEKIVSKAICSWEKKQKRGDIPVGKDIWDSQYISGYWKYMQDLDELPRYSIITGYFQSLKPRGSILDVGCGEGILQQRLESFNYSKYVGIDISEVAITQGALRKSDKTIFICHNALHYIPNELFDVIVFNEILYYFDNPVEVVRKYTKYLNDDGIFITGMYLNSKRATSIWRNLRSVYISLDEVRVTNKSKSWIFNVFITQN